MGNDRAAASAEPAAAAEAQAESGYPRLQSVPPRPQLGYTVQQQREIVQALIADRENARYTSHVVRHRSGLSSLPPPSGPPEPAAPVDPEPAIGPPVPEPSLAEQEKLIDVLGVLLFGEPEDREPVGETGAHDDREEPAPQADASGEVPVPPARSAVAARVAAGPDLIDSLVDESVAQAPLPPKQSALAARLTAAEQIAATSAAPLPARRPAIARSAEAALPASLPGPPPVKPVVPAGSAAPPTPAQKPADHRSAAAYGSGASQAAAQSGVRAAVPIAATSAS